MVSRCRSGFDEREIPTSYAVPITVTLAAAASGQPCRRSPTALMPGLAGGEPPRSCSGVNRRRSAPRADRRTAMMRLSVISRPYIAAKKRARHCPHRLHRIIDTGLEQKRTQICRRSAHSHCQCLGLPNNVHRVRG